ncbi:MAG TPA: hypothetical protein VIG24_04765 [Acidimicrobiia bacterium]
MIAPIIRIVLRYGVGLVFGMEVGSLLAGDPDVVLLVATGVGVATEAVYAYAKKKGWAT